eukprot:TRINITY_DN3140_c0_g1_i4.p2 TRINITY_DN3140_c0_g1~~TRINITY_DN3140_c0_g1_i4.p2  ORF type:complete len:308 (-),score=32.34 TRINITY_DN3140_c0_g1_i4:294-1217(-)
MLGRKLRQIAWSQGVRWAERGVLQEATGSSLVSQCQMCIAAKLASSNYPSQPRFFLPSQTQDLFAPYNKNQIRWQSTEDKVEVAAPEGLGPGEEPTDEELLDLVARGRMSKSLLSEELQQRFVADRIVGPDFYELPSIPVIFSVASMIPFYMCCPPLVEFFLPLDYLGIGPEEMDMIARTQVAYASSMVAFFGAVHWGCAIMEFKQVEFHNSSKGMERYLIGVFPVFASFPCAVVMAPPLGAFLNALYLLVTYFNDRGMYSKDCLPTWYMRLRGPFTAGSVLALMISAISAFVVAIQDEEFAKKYHL